MKGKQEIFREKYTVQDQRGKEKLVKHVTVLPWSRLTFHSAFVIVEHIPDITIVQPNAKWLI